MSDLVIASSHFFVAVGPTHARCLSSCVLLWSPVPVSKVPKMGPVNNGITELSPLPLRYTKLLMSSFLLVTPFRNKSRHIHHLFQSFRLPSHWPTAALTAAPPFHGSNVSNCKEERTPTGHQPTTLCFWWLFLRENHDFFDRWIWWNIQQPIQISGTNSWNTFFGKPWGGTVHLWCFSRENFNRKPRSI